MTQDSHPQTDTLDRMYLEWSQFTKARNYRELKSLDLVKTMLVELNSVQSKDHLTLKCISVFAQLESLLEV